MKLATFRSSSTTRIRTDRRRARVAAGERGPAAGGPPASPIGLGRHAEVGLQGLVALGELLLDLLWIGERRDDDAVVAVLPVGGCGHLVVVGELERVENAEDL